MRRQHLVTWTVTDHCYVTSTHTATFTINNPAAVMVTEVSDLTTPAGDYADQAAINTAFTNWLNGFTVSGGCAPQEDHGSVSAPGLCGGSTTVTWTVTDHCYTTTTHSATFTVVSPNPLVINKPDNFTAASCQFTDQDAVNTAFDNWLTGFSVTGGFDPEGTIAGTPVAPVLCEGGTTTVTYNVTDECGSGSETATFTINGPAVLTINEPGDISTSSCNYDNQSAVDAAFAIWLGQFGVSGGCNPQGSFTATPVAPALCGGSVEVTYNVTDLCESGSATAIFSILPPPSVMIGSCPAGFSVTGCNTSAINGLIYSETPVSITQADFSAAGGSVSEGCLITSYTYEDSQSGSCPVIVTRTFTITDRCSNTVTCTQTIEINDNIAPVFEPAPSNTSYQCIADVPGPGYLGWTDNCSGSGEVAGVDQVSGQGCNLTITRTWTVQDACGNYASTTQVITVNDETAPALTNAPATSIVADCFTQFSNLPWVAPEWTDNCGSVILVSDVTEPSAQTTSPANYTRTWIVTDGCGNESSFVQTIEVPDCQEEYCTVTQYTLGSSAGSFCDGQSSLELMESLLNENGPMVLGIPANNRSFTVPVVGGAQCVMDILPAASNANALTGNYGCGNFGNLLRPDGTLYNSLLAEAITFQFNLWLTPALADLLLESPEFYVRSSSGCGGQGNYPLSDSTHYMIDPTVYNYLGNDPTVQDLMDLANLALGRAVLPGPDAPTRANIKYALIYINEAFENCGFIYFVPPLSNNIELAKTGTYVDNEPIGEYNAGDQIEYEFSVSNTGNLTLFNVMIDDPLVSVAGNPIASLVPGAVDNTTFSAVYTLTAEDILAGSLTNIATVTGIAGSNAYYDTDDDVQTFTLPDRVLNLQVFLEGLYNGPGIMRQAYDENGPHAGPGIADIITVELHAAADYGSILFSDDVDLGVDGTAGVSVPAALSGPFYITIRHRNSIETTSSVPVSMDNTTISYSFDTPAKAFGGNLLLMITGEYVIFGGDVNQDGSVDTGDMTPVDNDAAGFMFGYISSDVNGDGTVDTGDMTIIDNNAAGFVGSVTP
ncbi:MAG: hypothetical protein IPF68_15850 [Bacteroidales bacterium]|nr:hypothetical protein [Bacteroidales bacterium]